MTVKNIDQLGAAGSLAGTDKTMLAQGDALLKRTTLSAIYSWIVGQLELAAVATSGAKADVGLGNVDNTSDATKNAATATLTNKTLTSPVVNSPTGIVKADVGLGNVPNVDATARANHTGTQDASTVTGLAAVATSGSAADLGAGTLADARLSSNVARRDQSNSFGDNSISRFAFVSSAQTDDYTLAQADNGSVVYLNKATAVAVTLPNSLPAGFNCTIVQEGAGQVTFAAASGATKQTPGGASKTAIRYGAVSVFVKSNSGAAADWRLNGDLTT